MPLRNSTYEVIEADDTDHKNAPLENVCLHEFSSKTDGNSKWSFRRIRLALEGKLMILLGGSISIFCLTMVKRISSIPVGQFTAIVLIAALPILASTALFTLQHPLSFHGKAKFLAPRVIFGSLVGIIKMWSFRVMPPGDVQAMLAPTAVFAAIFSRILWGEKISIFTIISLALSIIGIVLIVKPSFIFSSVEVKSYSSYFSLVPFGACILLGLAYSFMRKIGSNTISTLTISLCMSVTISIFGLAFQLITQEPFVLPGCTDTRFYLVCIGVGFSVSLILLNRGLLLEKSGPGVLMRNFDMVMAFLLQVFLFEEPVELLSIGGSLLIFLAVVVVTLDRLFFSKRANSCQF